MPEHNGPRIFTCAGFYLIGYLKADSAKLPRFLIDSLSSDCSRALGNNYDRELSPLLFSLKYFIRNFISRIRDLRDQDTIGASGDSGKYCDPSRMAAHNFE